MSSPIFWLALAAGIYPAAPANMRCQVDEFKATRFCHAAKQRTAQQGVSLHLYTAESPNSKSGALRANFWYVGENWIFANEAIFILDDTIVPPLKLKFDHDSGSVVIEHADVLCEAACISLFRRITTANQVKLRISGTKGVRDTVISNRTKDELTTVLSYFDSIGKR